MPHLVPVTPGHYLLIEQLAHQTWPTAFGDILSAEQIQYMLSWMYSPDAITEQVDQKGHVFLLAEDDAGEPLGYVSYELTVNEKPVTKIHKIYLLPASQGQGIGRMMIDYVAKQAEHVENVALQLNVNRQNKAVAFYEKMGFEVVGEEDIDIGNGFLMEDYIMMKRL
jgi:ribosomal protein S18 acetylase RimI-like enzyme